MRRAAFLLLFLLGCARAEAVAPIVVAPIESSPARSAPRPPPSEVVTIEPVAAADDSAPPPFYNEPPRAPVVAPAPPLAPVAPPLPGPGLAPAGQLRITSTLRTRLASGVPVDVEMCAANTTTVVATCRVVRDLWDDVYRVKTGGGGSFAVLDLDVGLRRCAGPQGGQALDVREAKPPPRPKKP
jgi:hypothetical protein